MDEASSLLGRPRRPRLREYWVVGATALVLAATVVRVGFQEQPMLWAGSSLPHVAMIIVDDAGWNDFGYGSDDIVTPAIDSLARRGVILDQYYGQSLCTVARASLLTGLFPHRTGMVPPASTPQTNLEILPYSNFSIPLGITLLPGYLKEAATVRGAGLKAYAIGKWNLGHCNHAYLPTARGFDSFEGYFNGDVSYYSRRPDRWSYVDDRGDVRPLTDMVRVEDGVLTPLKDTSQHTEEQFLEAALAKLRLHRRRAAPRAFLYLGLHVAHDADEFDIPTKLLAQCSSRDVDYGSLAADLDASSRRGRFAGAMLTADAIVACVENELQRHDNYVLVVASDNGGNACALDLAGSSMPLRGNKGTLFDGGIRVPAVLYASTLVGRRRGGHVYRGLAHHVDWIPTLVNAFGVTLPTTDHLDGVSHWDSIMWAPQDPPYGDNRTLFFLLTGSNFALRHRNFKLQVEMPNQSWYPFTTEPATPICTAAGAPEPGPIVSALLFDVQSDPNETTNLADDGAYSDVLRHLIHLARTTHASQSYTPQHPFAMEGSSSSIRNRTVFLSSNAGANAAMRDAGGFVVPWGCETNNM